MAVIVKDAKASLVKQSGARGIRELILASPSIGCNRFNARTINISPDGMTAMQSFKGNAFYFVHQGRVTLIEEGAGMDVLEAGNAALVLPGTRHRLQNLANSSSVIVTVIDQ